MVKKKKSSLQRTRGRPKQFADRIALRLSADQVEGIAETRVEGEEQTAFIRSAIDREIARRQKG